MDETGCHFSRNPCRTGKDFKIWAKSGGVPEFRARAAQMWTWPQVQGDLCGLPGCPVQNVPEAHSVFKPRIENKVQLLPQACLLYRGALVNIITANNTVPSHFFFCACPVVCSLRPGVHNCRLMKRNEGCIYLYT